MAHRNPYVVHLWNHFKTKRFSSHHRTSEPADYSEEIEEYYEERRLGQEERDSDKDG